MNPRATPAVSGVKGVLLASLLLTVVLAALFHRSFESSQTLFANDGPLGAAKAAFAALPQLFTGGWNDLLWIGNNGGSAAPMPTNLIRMSLGAVGYSKFYEPLSLLFLGLCALYYFRVATRSLVIALLAALAAMLNMNFFSNVCWGLGTRATCLGMIFLSLAFALKSEEGRRWLRLALAGLCVGMAVLEGADNGAIFSLCVAAFVLFRSFRPGQQAAKAAFFGMLRLGVVTVCAGWMAAHAFSVLIPTHVLDAGSGASSPKLMEENWDGATEWSLPKIEILRTMIPGLFGYRMDTPEGGEYWGTVGRRPGWEEHREDPRYTARYSGAGEYAGVLVLAIGLWAVARSLAKPAKSGDDLDRRTIQFWAVCAFISVLFAFGRYAPFYRIVYSLPYFSSIRNPIKFMHVFHLCAMVLFGYGLLDLYKNYLRNPKPPLASLGACLGAAFKKTGSFERKWMLGSIVVFGAAVLGFLMFASAKGDVIKYLVVNALPAQDAPGIFNFARGEILLFLVFLAASLGLVAAIASGAFAGRRAKWAGILLGIVLVLDLARSDRPWIQYYNYKEKYATNPLFDELRDHPFEHRVTARITPFSQSYLAGRDQFGQIWGSVYDAVWLQHDFLYYNIQSPDIAQWARTPGMDQTYAQNFISGTSQIPFARLWQLTNTRYILGFRQFLDDLNMRFDPQSHRFQIKTFFTLTANESNDPTLPPRVLTNADGPLALYDFTGALPRAKLYTRWQTTTNDQETLAQLVNPAFDPVASAFIYGDSAAPPTSTATNAPEGSVEWVSYAPKKIVLKTKAAARSLLLLNDRHDPGWVVRVDGARVPLLRCNYIMRGAMIDAGDHEVVFHYEADITGFEISLSAILFGLILGGFLIIAPGQAPAEAPAQASAPAPSPPPPSPSPSPQHARKKPRS